MGPVLFLLYINDIISASKILQLILFADDTNIFLSDVTLDRLLTTVNKELTYICDWFAINKLSLNVSKTNFVLFCNEKSNMTNLKSKLSLMGRKLYRFAMQSFWGFISTNDLPGINIFSR